MFEELGRRTRARMYGMWNRTCGEALRVVRETKGQGTTEYAILVGVLVVIAIIAVVAFRGRLQELWSAISDAVNSL